MTVSIRPATHENRDAMVALLPRLADFDIPPGRHPEHLWSGDRDMLLSWLDGTAPNVRALVSVEGDTLLGFTLLSFKEEMLSHEPSAHLEVLVLSKEAEGRGVGKALIEATETVAREGGATSMSLHVFARNTRARGLYERMGFDGELLRYYKPLT